MILGNNINITLLSKLNNFRARTFIAVRHSIQLNVRIDLNNKLRLTVERLIDRNAVDNIL